jgi:hypothetical protein
MSTLVIVVGVGSGAIVKQFLACLRGAHVGFIPTGYVCRIVYHM